MNGGLIMVNNCLECGISGVKSDGNRWCEKYKMVVGIPELKKSSCPCFLEFQYEDGELMTPLQHLYLMENEKGSRRMRGPI